MSETHHYETSGKLVRVLGDWQGEQRDMYAIWPSGRLLNARARCLLAYMEHFIADVLATDSSEPSLEISR